MGFFSFFAVVADVFVAVCSLCMCTGFATAQDEAVPTLIIPRGTACPIPFEVTAFNK